MLRACCVHVCRGGGMLSMSRVCMSGMSGTRVFLYAVKHVFLLSTLIKMI